MIPIDLVPLQKKIRIECYMLTSVDTGFVLSPGTCTNTTCIVISTWGSILEVIDILHYTVKMCTKKNNFLTFALFMTDDIF